MGLAQSIAQSTMNRVAVRFASIEVRDVPFVPQAPKTVGSIDATIGITTHDLTGADATVRASTATLEMPPIEGFEGFGEFAHFIFPELPIRLGTNSHDFTADFVVTNQTLFKTWSEALSSVPGGVPVVIRATPEVKDTDIIPITNTLKMDKQLQCLSLATSGDAINVSMTCDYLGQAPAEVSYSALSITSGLDDGWVLDLHDGDTKSGTRVSLNSRHATDANPDRIAQDNQFWLFQNDAGGAITYASDPTKCLSFGSSDNSFQDGVHGDSEVHLCLEPCDGTDKQSFRYDATARTLESALYPPGQFCMDLKDGKLADGQPVILQQCSGAANQQWSFATYVDPYVSSSVHV